MWKICRQGLRALQLLLALYGSFLFFPLFLMFFSQIKVWLHLGQVGEIVHLLPLLSYGFLGVFLVQSLMRPWFACASETWYGRSLLGLVGLQSLGLVTYLLYVGTFNTGTGLVVLLLGASLSAQLLRERLGVRLNMERYCLNLTGIFGLILLFSLLMSQMGLASSLILGLTLLFLLDALLLWGQLEKLEEGTSPVPSRQAWLGLVFYSAILFPLVVVYSSPLGKNFGAGLRLAPAYDQAVLISLCLYLLFFAQWLGVKEAYLTPVWQAFVEGLNGSMSSQQLETYEELCQQRMDKILLLWLLEFILLLAGLALYSYFHPLNWVHYYIGFLLPAYCLLQLLQVFQSLFQDLLQFGLVWRLACCFLGVNVLFAMVSIWAGIFYFGLGFFLSSSLTVAVAYCHYERLRGQWLYAIVSYYD
ncbi:exopolysaccharide Pel transporter PelG [Streptococcus sp. NLN64]|uniref:exopolysaccharide Pel transporter PelG n=1 Tax=Streptococcus sp. NLN64 TaxID=2822799 RepID=UPI0018C9F4A6|nr:exopolysaccharide Pel transporter PelG [Streptococcus sp. NLN64]MBG9367811.1 hypothetical protein [Streptococcus sp. NLN64]